MRKRSTYWSDKNWQTKIYRGEQEPHLISGSRSDVSLKLSLVSLSDKRSWLVATFFNFHWCQGKLLLVCKMTFGIGHSEEGGGGVQDGLICKSFKAWPVKLDCSDEEKALQVLETNLLICADHKSLIGLNVVNQLTTLESSSRRHP